MGIRDLLKKKDHLDKGSSSADHQEALDNLTLPEFTFIRSDTHTQEVVFPPDHPPGYGEAEHEAQHGQSQYLKAEGGGGSTNNSRSRLSLDVFRSSSGTGGRSRSVSVGSSKSAQSQGQSDGQGSRSPRAEKPSAARRLSQRLHLQRAPSSSEVVPSNLPMIVTPEEGEPPDGVETQWEARATMLARENEKHRSRPATPSRNSSYVASEKMASPPGTAGSVGYVSSKEVDDDIQEAIRLHEAGDLSRSTAMFGRLADPAGANNPLSQVLYGLALRHGWGCQPDPTAAVNYLSAAASNAASVESLALQAGLKKGGAAKGELVLAIFELANCFRHGWGIPKDPIAAKQYYETAANLGDTDAMNEVAWCYVEGFGCKKDKFTAAKYYRLAEQNGNKTLGNTWIWKDKYDPGNAKK